MPAAAPLDFLPPQLDRRVLSLSRWLLPLWLRQCSDIRDLQLQDGERLVQALQAFQAGDSRLLLAFRHPSIDDPACMARLLWQEVPRLGRRQGLRWHPAPHAQFLYDRGIPLWAGASMGWLLRRLGGCSIQRGRLDLPALRTARQLLLEGPHPFAVAPEGATNGHNELVSPLEPGVAQLALWTAEELERSGRPEAMTLLPIGIQYRFLRSPWRRIATLIAQLEQEAGLAPGDGPLLDRLLRLSMRFLDILERFYREAYHKPLPTPSLSDPAELLAARLQQLREAALQVVEQALLVEPRGDLTSRCRRLEQAGWDRLFPSQSGSEACPLERGLADRLADATEQQLWHMRMVESFVAVSGRYVRDCPSPERFADLLLLLWDTSCRIQGRDASQRPSLGPRQVLLRIGAPLPVRPLLAHYRQDRRAAVAELTATLQQRLEQLIVATQP
ncbi:MAG: 1-acyl-sn-glycerol-3-phosphate acyltransferase [Synechococcaceae cyanobacterium]|nr:1-acyl-sn-glycerol-3-phosphate acyltransferase [Synechococcaceae cyanobacterium]